MLWYFSALAIDKEILPAHFDYVAKFFTILIATLIGAFAAFLFNSILDSKKTENEKSKFYLDLCIENYEMFRSILGGLNNSRVDWIYAARLLLETKSLEPQITNSEHIRVLGIKTMKVRHDLLNEFQIIDKGSNTESSLPVSFFYGVDNWKDYIDSPDDAAYEAFRSNRPAVFGEYEVSRVERLPMLSETSIFVVFEFLSFPDDFEDYLSKNKYPISWPEKVKIFQGEGAYKYVKHRKEYVHPESGISKEHRDKIREMLENGEIPIADTTADKK